MASLMPMIQSSEAAKPYKIIVIGDSNVGKTCLTYRFCEGKFLDGSEATIGIDFRERIVDVDGQPVKLQLWDTAGQERFRRSMIAHYYRSVDAIVFVYDVTSESSFESLRCWVEECRLYDLEDVPKILVGNKCDSPAKVPRYKAHVFADQHRMPFFEASAKSDNENIDSIFLTLAHKLKNHQPLRLSNPIVNEQLINEPIQGSFNSCC